MRSPLTFGAFVREGHHGLLEELANAWESTILICSLEGEPLWSSDPPALEPQADGDLPRASRATVAPAGAVRTRRVAGEGAALEAPIDVRGETVGVVRSQGRVPVGIVKAAAGDLSARFVSASDLDELTIHLSQCYEELNLLYRLSRALNPDGDFAASCSALLRETADFLRARTVVLFLDSEHEQVVDAAVAQGGPISATVAALMGPERNKLLELHGELVERMPVTNDGISRRHFGAIPGRDGAALPVTAIPVYGRDGLAGFVAVLRHHDEDAVESGELRFLECLAAQLSSATTNRELRTELRGVLFNTVKSLVAAVDAKDAYTRGHSERVYLLSVQIGRHLGLNHEELQTLTWSALLHDVGKIAMPLEILTKPSRLTNAEFEIIKTHPERGCKVIEPIPQLRSVLPGIRHHHERFDGRGYPDNLAGETIPLMARIIAVADTYDAMVSSRAYRQARSFEFAVEEIRNSSGTQLDPRIVSAFIELVEAGAIEQAEIRSLEEAA